MMKVEYLNASMDASTVEVDADEFHVDGDALLAYKNGYRVFAVPMARLVTATLTRPAVANPTDSENRLPGLD